MKSIYVFVLAGLLLAGCSSSQRDAKDESGAFDSEYTRYAQVLSDYVRNEAVDYQGLKENRADLDGFINELAELTMEEYDRMDRDEQKALWINAYNAIILRSVIDAYPVASIKDIDGVFGSKRWKVAGKRVTLDDIEHNILRPDFDDPRIHFAICNGSVGSPALLGSPFLPDKLARQLDAAVEVFVNNPDRNKVNPHINVISTTEIFKLYVDDFSDQYEGVEYADLDPADAVALKFIFSFADESILEFVDESGEWTVEYIPWDWSLNDVKR